MKVDTHGSKEEEWIGFDLDGTLAKYDGWKGVEHIGEPVDTMVIIAKMLHRIGKKIKVLTARVAPRDDGEGGDKAKKYVEAWCKKNLGFVPEITYEKDASMAALFDDRAVAVEQNTGKVLGGWPDFLPKASDKAKKAVLGKIEKKAEDISICDGTIEDVRKVISGLSDEEKKLILRRGRTEYKDVPQRLAGRTVAYDKSGPVGFVDIYGVDNQGRVRSSPSIVVSVLDRARGNRLASKMARDAMEKVVGRVNKNRKSGGRNDDRLRRFVWRLHKGNESSARAAGHAGFKEQYFKSPHRFRQFIMSREDLEKKAADRPSKEDLWRMYDIMQADAKLSGKVSGLGFGRKSDAYRKAAIKLRIKELANVVKDGRRIRNRIAHTPGYVPSEQDAGRALRQYADADRKISEIIRK